MNLLNDMAVALLPETFLVIITLICLIFTFMLKKKEQNLVFVAALCGLILTLSSFLFLPSGETQTGFYGAFVSDGFTILFRILIVIGAIITVLLSKRYVWNFGFVA